MSNKNQKIEELLTRGVENLYPNREFLEELLQSGKKIKLYLGIDPTGPSLHVGHAIPLNKLRQFQELGHEIILLIGSFTAMIGDPTDKSATRKQLTREEVMENCKNYQDQAKAVLAFEGDNPVKVMYNSDWHDKLTFKEVVELSSHFTVQQMAERDMFANRIADGKPIGLHEFLYPLMQGYDSVAMEVDGEVGGNDQTFNMLAGRTLMKALGKGDKFVITMKLLTDVHGKKMGKTEGNMLTLGDTPQDMYGKVMSWTDDMIGNGFELCTNLSMEEIAKIRHELYEIKEGNPRDYKMQLAKEVVTLYHGPEIAQEAENTFIKMFQKKEMPDVIEDFKVGADTIELVEVLVQSGLCSSKSEARRVIDGKGVKVNKEVIEDIKAVVEITDEGIVVQKGKRAFRRLVK